MMGEWFGVLSWAPKLLTFVLGLGVVGSALCRIHMLDIKRHRLGYVALYFAAAIGGAAAMMGKPWAVLVLLLAVFVQHLLTWHIWPDKPPRIAEKEPHENRH